MPAGAAQCPECAGGGWLTTSRQSAVLISLIVLCALFAAAGFLNQTFRRHEQDVAREWYERGEQELATGRAEAALDPFRTALVYSRNNPQYELRLGEALVAARHYGEAKTYLLSLWEREPGSAALNLELARLAARSEDVSGAIHYYEASLYGVWASNGEQQRRAARRELITFLMDHGRKAEALAHTMSYAANLPPDAELHIQAGKLFLQEGSEDHALEQFREALAVAPRNATALALAGNAALAGGDFFGAERYLERASRAAPGDGTVADHLAVVRAIRSLDPNVPGLSARARASRALYAFQLAKARLGACQVPVTASGGESLRALALRASALELKLRNNQLVRDIDLFSATVEFALDAEGAAAPVCSTGSVEDRALAALAQHRYGGAQ